MCGCGGKRKQLILNLQRRKQINTPIVEQVISTPSNNVKNNNSFKLLNSKLPSSKSLKSR